MTEPQRRSAGGTSPSLRSMSCSDGWFVTGYYTPEEDEFGGQLVPVEIAGHGQDEFKAGFLKHVRIEGWGLTRHGWFLGFERKWLKGPAPLNARGKSLVAGSLAVDRSVIPLGTSVRIPSLKDPWNNQLFVADDVGGAIIGKHVDVYCGAGKVAHAETLRITSDGQRLCLG